MESILVYLETLAVAVLIGKVIFLSFIVAPVLARTLEPEPFGRVVRELFPAYYLLGIGAATVGFSVVAGLTLFHGADAFHAAALILWLSIILIDLYCYVPLVPRVNAMRDEIKRQELQGHVETGLRAKWNELHQRSVRLNATVLAIGLCLVGLV
jgi:hypothetical protein